MHSCYHCGGGPFYEGVTKEELSFTSSGESLYNPLSEFFYATTTRLQICRYPDGFRPAPTTFFQARNSMINQTNAMRDYILSANAIKSLPNRKSFLCVHYLVSQLNHLSYVKYGPNWIDMQKERVKVREQVEIDQNNRQRQARADELVTELNTLNMELKLVDGIISEICSEFISGCQSTRASWTPHLNCV